MIVVTNIDLMTFGSSAVTLDLQEGGTYTFDVSDSTMNHPFVIGTAFRC